MRPTKIPGETRVFGKPANWDDEKMGECGALSVRDARVDGAATMTSLWEFEPADLALLMKGGLLELRIYGTEHPVVSLAVAFVR